MEAALEALEAVFHVQEGGAEGEFSPADVAWAIRVKVQAVVNVERALPELGLYAFEAANLPFIPHESVDEVPLARGGGLEFPVVLFRELSEGLRIFAADDMGFGVNAGLEGVHPRDGFAGLGAGAGGELRIATIRGELFFGWHGNKKGPGVAGSCAIPVYHTGRLESEIRLWKGLKMGEI
jgi:hypothetical protein